MKNRQSSDDEVYEIKKTVLKNPIIFAGFVGAGLVGPLSVGYVIDKLQMEEIGYLDQDIYHHQLFSCKDD